MTGDSCETTKNQIQAGGSTPNVEMSPRPRARYIISFRVLVSFSLLLSLALSLSPSSSLCHPRARSNPDRGCVSRRYDMSAVFISFPIARLVPSLMRIVYVRVPRRFCRPFSFPDHQQVLPSTDFNLPAQEGYKITP